MTDTKQRVRVIFARDATLKYVGHLDMARTWQRILRRAQLPVAHSEGFNPQPKITFAGALPVGCLSAYEVMDLVLERPLACEVVQAQLARAVPPGIQIRSIVDVPLNAPALQVQLMAAEYEMTVADDVAAAPLADRVAAFLAASEVQRERRGKSYNLRPLVQTLTIERQPDRVVVRSRLQNTEAGTGRPDELLRALGLDPAVAHIVRTQLVFLDKTP